MGPSDFVTALAASRAGDEAGLTWLWRTWNPAVHRFLRARNSPTPDDLAASVWLDVARGLHRFEGGENDFPRWLFTIARRRLIDDLRQRHTRPEVLMGETPPPAASPDVADLALARDGQDWAVSLIRRLAPDQADAVLLRVVADLDVAAAAEVLGKSPGAVRVLTHRGLRRLAELLQRDGSGGWLENEGVTGTTPRSMEELND